MAVDKDTVARIAKLARIKVGEAEQQALADELSNIIGWVEQLSELDTEDIEPMTSVVEIRLPLRKDEITDGGRGEDIVANAPEAAHGFFVVPKVVE